MKKSKIKINFNLKNSFSLNKMNIKTWNWMAAITHALIAVGLIIYFILKKGTINFNIDLYKYGIDLNQDDPENSNVFATKVWTVSPVVLKVLVVVYFFFTAFFHTLYATDAFGSGAYTRALAAQNNYFRWIEYAISSTIMTFLIAIISGVKGFDTVILLLLVNIAIMICGQIVESATGPNALTIRVLATAIGWTLLLGVFFVIFYNFFNALNDGKRNNFDIPWYVWGIVFPLFLWYALFGVVSILQAFVTPRTPQNYLKFEKAYIFLSFFSKINLGLFIAFGLTRPKAEKNE